MAPGLGDKHPRGFHHGSPGTPSPGAPQHHVQHPGQEPGTAEGTDISHHVPGLGLYRTASPGIRGITQGSVGHKRPCHHLPRSLGKGCSPSALSWAALLHGTAQTFQPGDQKAKREPVGSCFVLIQHPARHLSQSSPVLTQSCPIPPPAKGCWHVPGPCPVPSPWSSCRTSPRGSPWL